jgi:Mrp family chromosome partitioning ATPase
MQALRWRTPEGAPASVAPVVGASSAPPPHASEPRDTTQMPHDIGQQALHRAGAAGQPPVTIRPQTPSTSPPMGPNRTAQMPTVAPAPAPAMAQTMAQPGLSPSPAAPQAARTVIHGQAPPAAPPLERPELPPGGEIRAPGGRSYSRPRTAQFDLPWQTQVGMVVPGGGSRATGNFDVAQVARAMEIARAAEIGMAAQQAVAQAGTPSLTGVIEVQPQEPTTEITVYKLERPVEFDRRLVMLRDPDSEAAAGYRVLRYRVLDRGMPRVIVVSSPSRHEGKTTAAVNLALALGECGRARVLLVEANLRTPSLAKLLAFMPPVCFADQVAKNKDNPDAAWTVVEAHSPWLHVAAVRPDREREEAMLDGPAIALALDRLRLAGYDHIVVDTPAVLGAADVNIVQDCADGVVLVVKARETAGRHLRRAMEQLAPARVLGLVMLT